MRRREMAVFQVTNALCAILLGIVMGTGGIMLWMLVRLKQVDINGDAETVARSLTENLVELTGKGTMVFSILLVLAGTIVMINWLVYGKKYAEFFKSLSE